MGFDVIVRGPKVASFLNVGIVGRGGEDHSRKVFELGAGGEPNEDIEACEARHFEVEHKQHGQRVLGAVGKRGFPLKICQYFNAIVDEDYFASQRGFLSGHTQDHDFRFVVFCYENGRKFVHCEKVLEVRQPSDADGDSVELGVRSSTQNRLPIPGSDSASAWPPMRSVTLRTMAKPMPVPS
jgi:hypothetical protein